MPGQAILASRAVAQANALQISGALDEVRETLEVGEAVVQPGSASILTVDLSRFKRDLGTLRACRQGRAARSAVVATE